MLGGPRSSMFKRIGNTRPADRAQHKYTAQARTRRWRRASREGFSDSLLARDDGRDPAAPGTQVGADRRQRAAASTDIPGGERSRSSGVHMRSLRVRRAQFDRSSRVRNAADQSSLVGVRALRAPKATLPPPPGAAAPARTRRSPRCPDGAACSSAITTTSRSCRTPMRARVAPTRASATSSSDVWDFTTRRPSARRTSHYVEPLAAREEGSGGRAVRAEGSRSSSGSTARCPRSTARPCATASSSGTRRSSRSASRTRSS